MRLITLCCEYPPIGGGGATACEVLAEAFASESNGRSAFAAPATTGQRPSSRAGWRRFYARRSPIFLPTMLLSMIFAAAAEREPRFSRPRISPRNSRRFSIAFKRR